MGFVYTSSVGGWTPVAHADGASALANASYHGLYNVAATDIIKVQDVLITGGALASAINEMALRRISTNSNTPTAVAPGKNSGNAPASSPQQTVAASTGPTIASTTHLWDGDINVLGGAIRMGLIPGAEILCIGTTQPNAQLNLDAVTGTGVVTTMIVFETL